MFDDGERTIDFVLVYVEPTGHRGSNPAVLRDAERKREIFEKHLEEEGLQLEREDLNHIHFIKIHAPHDVLARYCEILKLRMPMKEVCRKQFVTLQITILFFF